MDEEMGCGKRLTGKGSVSPMKPYSAIIVLAIALASTTGCRTVVPSPERRVTCEFDAQLLALPSCSATVVDKSPCQTFLKLHTGDILTIGSPGPSPMIARFRRTLEIGKTYYLPREFMEFLRKQETKPIH